MGKDLLLGTLLALAACGNGATGSSIAVNLTAQNASGESGSALLTDQGGDKTRVDIAVAGNADVGNRQQAHLHAGTCGSGGAVQATLASVQAGRSSGDVPYALSALTGGRSSIDVHRSDDPNSVVACGNVP